MSTIKPPSGSHPSDLANAVSDAGASEATSRASGPEAGAGAPEVGAPAAAGGTSLPEALDPLASLAADIRSGRLSAEAALDAMVERALGDVDATLSPAQRTELETLLRSMLSDDPTLAAMREGWPAGGSND